MMLANILPLHTEETEQAAINGRAVLYAKLARVMGKVNRIAKSGTNTHFNYKFATAPDIYDVIRTAMAEENVAFIPTMLEVKPEVVTLTNDYQGKVSSKQVIKTRITFEFTFACGETGAVKTCIWESATEDTQDTSIGKAVTYAVKSFLIATFLISTGDIADDLDASPATEDKAAQNGKPAASKPPRRIPQPAPARTEAGQQTDTPAQPKAKPDKTSSLFQWLMQNVNHPRYQDSHARAKAIQKLQAADILFEAMPHEQALKLVMAYGNLRDNEASENAAMLEVRKLAAAK